LLITWMLYAYVQCYHWKLRAFQHSLLDPAL
jgi:hypothetical protein